MRGVRVCMPSHRDSLWDAKTSTVVIKMNYLGCLNMNVSYCERIARLQVQSNCAAFCNFIYLREIFKIVANLIYTLGHKKRATLFLLLARYVPNVAKRSI